MMYDVKQEVKMYWTKQRQWLIGSLIYLCIGIVINSVAIVKGGNEIDKRVAHWMFIFGLFGWLTTMCVVIWFAVTFKKADLNRPDWSVEPSGLFTAYMMLILYCICLVMSVWGIVLLILFGCRETYCALSVMMIVYHLLAGFLFTSMTWYLAQKFRIELFTNRSTDLSTNRSTDVSV